MVNLVMYKLKKLIQKVLHQKDISRMHMWKNYPNQKISTLLLNECAWILEAKYKKVDFKIFTKEECQRLTEDKCKYLLWLLQNIEDSLDGTIYIWKIDPVYFELKEDAKLEIFRPRPISKVYE